MSAISTIKSNFDPIIQCLNDRRDSLLDRKRKLRQDYLILKLHPELRISTLLTKLLDKVRELRKDVDEFNDYISKMNERYSISYHTLSL